MNNTNIIELFLKQASLYPSHVAIQTGKEKLTYHELAQRAAAYKSCFEKQGIQSKQKILILHPVNTELYAAMLALLATGCTLVFAEEWAGLHDMAACQQHMQCDAMITNTKIGLVTLLYASLRKMKKIKLSVQLTNEPVEFITAKPGVNQPAIISFSSGTGGAPKAVIRTHEILQAQFDALRKHISLKPGDTMCTNFPVVILLNLALGLTTYISQAIVFSALEKTDFEKLYQELNEMEIGCLACSPYIIHQLALTILHQQPSTASGVLHIITGGSPFFPVYADTVSKVFPTANVHVLYGSSEAEPIAYCSATDILLHRNGKGLFAGAIDAHTLCKIGRVEAGQFIEHEPGVAGEIIVAGDHVVTQYYNSAEALATNKFNIENRIWHRTGDYGYFDEQHQLFLTGNLAYATETTFLFELEKELSQMAGIAHATILLDTAYIQKQPQAHEEALRKQVERRFPWVTTIKFVQIPFDKRHHGKIRYGVLASKK